MTDNCAPALIWISARGHEQAVSDPTMTKYEYQPLSPAPHTGIFEEVNVFGSATGGAAFVTEGDALPAAPRGFTWRPLGTLSVAELRQRAEEYRRMADTARTAQVKEGLLRLAERFDALADRRGG